MGSSSPNRGENKKYLKIFETATQILTTLNQPDPERVLGIDKFIRPYLQD